MIYLDNGATSFPKPKGMTWEMDDCILNYCGNPGRSGHFMSMKTGEQIYKARKQISRIFNIEDPSRLIFTKNTTEALNLGIFGFLQPGDHVVTTSMEHNSVLRPLKEAGFRGISHTIVPADSLGRITAAEVAAAVTPNTRLIILTGASNVTGTIMPVTEVGQLAERLGIAFMVDAAQSAGSVPIDVKAAKISMLAFPGHKGLLGPLGTGGLYVSPGTAICPLLCGGTGTESKSQLQPWDFPEGFEAGTLNAPAIIGLGFSAGFIEKVGVETIGFHEQQLIGHFEERVRNMDFVQVYGPEAKEKTGISLFNIRGVECEETAARLGRDYGIAVRGGWHCSGLAHKTIGTFDTGAVRLSAGPFNTRKDIDAAIRAVWEIGKSAGGC